MADRPVGLVTGASRGIGASFARGLAARGYDLIVVARETERLEKLAAELSVEVEVITADLTDAEQLARVEARVTDPSRPVDLLVNNAGFGTTGKFVDLPVDGEDREIRLNVLALVRLSHAAARSMSARGRGGIINISSMAGFQPTPGTATYGATKAFVTSFTLALHEEQRGSGVDVVVVCPGATRTDFQDNANYDVSRLPSFAWQEPEQVVVASLAALRRHSPICTPGVVNKFAAAATHLAPRRFIARVVRMVVPQG